MNELKLGAFLNYVAIGVNMVVGLLYTPYMLRMLGQSEFGMYSLAASVIAYLTVLDLGLGNAIVRYTAKLRAEGKEQEQQYMFGMFMALFLLMSVITLFVGAFMAANTDLFFGKNMSPYEVERTRKMFWLLVFNLAYTFPMSVWGSIMWAYERFVFQRLLSIIRNILNPLVMVVLLMYGYKAVAMVVVTTLFNVLTLLMNYWYCKKKLNIKLRFGRFDRSLLKEVACYSFWIFLCVIMDRIYWNTGQFVLGIYKGAVAIAIYAVAIQFQQLYMTFSWAISGLMLPKVTALVAQGDNPNEMASLFIRTGRIQYVVMAFIVTGFVIFGREFIHFWAGNEYDESYFLALLFLIPLTIPQIQSVGTSILQARNQMKFMGTVQVLVGLGCLCLSFLLAPVWGGIGCAISVSVALLVGQGIIMNYHYHRVQHLNIILFWKEIGSMSWVPFGFIFVYLLTYTSVNSWISTPWGFLGGVTFFVILYVPLFWKFALNTSEKQLIMSFGSMLKKKIVQ